VIKAIPFNPGIGFIGFQGERFDTIEIQPESDSALAIDTLQINTVPEPSSFVLLLPAMALALALRCRVNRNKSIMLASRFAGVRAGASEAGHRLSFCRGGPGRSAFQKRRALRLFWWRAGRERAVGGGDVLVPTRTCLAGDPTGGAGSAPNKCNIRLRPRMNGTITTCLRLSLSF
jgi:hypothetical protein